MRRRAVTAAITVVALASLLGVPSQASSALKAPPFAAGSYRQLPAAELVNVRELPATVPQAHRAFVRPELVKNHAARAATPHPALPRKGGGNVAAASIPPPPPTTQGTILEQLTVFPGMDVNQGIALFGQDNNIEPSDTQVAAGPSVVVEMVNANMSVWSKSGTRLAAVDLNLFYGVSAPLTITDPRVLYDQSSGRFIASAVAIDTATTSDTWNSNVYLAVSQSSDPTGTWAKQALKITSAVLLDQPKVGTSDNKITLAWSEWIKPGCDPNYPTYPCFVGEVFSVVDKIDMLTGGPGFEYLSGRDTAHYAVVPVQALSSTTTQYMAYNNADPFNLVENQCGQTNPPSQYGPCPTLGIISITGSARANTISLAEADRPIAATTTLPSAVQQGPAGTGLIDTGDDRLLTAVWQNNQLWTSNGDGNFCSFPNPTGPGARSCLRIHEVRTDTVPMTVQQQFTIDTGDFSYHPAISLDNAGDAFIVFSRSSSTMYPSVWINGVPASNPTCCQPPALLAAGTGPYDSKATCGGKNRWGDYSGASVDGSDPTDVWVAGEYAAMDARNCTWKTVLARLTYSAPTVTSITPATGPGGTSVTITGTDFSSTGLGTIPYFGATPVAPGTTTVQSPNRLTTTAPPGNGWVRVSAKTDDGQGPAGPTFKYPRLEAAPGSLTALPGAISRGGAPPRVPPKVAGPRPLNAPTLPFPEGGGKLQPVRLFRLLLL
jgi:hypothetical protein